MRRLVIAMALTASTILPAAAEDGGWATVTVAPPDGVRINRFSPYFVVLLYGRPHVRLRLMEAVGGAIEKYAGIDQRVERVEVDGEPGIWVEGRHVGRELFGLPRRAGNALLWKHDGLTLRLEGQLSRDEALHLAHSVK